MSEFLIMFREVLEGVLVVGILYTFIVKTGKLHLKKSITNGIVASFIATAIFAVIFQITYGGFEGKQAALFEGTTMLIAAFLLSTMIIGWVEIKMLQLVLKKKLPILLIKIRMFH
jgi:high-affinity iron transporter